ncbi:MAG: chemotaxis-related protein WspB [Thermodesulfobacteriota bacterium]|jgi:chemotaxis-related protein WspB|nr:chemotaxis-related protein WspB [Thermodesulfobacteriota bacterium]
MLVLQFRVGGDYYGLEGRTIIEVAPLVTLRSIPHAAAYVAGLFNYRGRLVPVIDLSALLIAVPSRPLMSTRIVLVNYELAPGIPKILGLIAEGATEVISCDHKRMQSPGMAIEGAPYLGKIWVDERKSLQLIDLPKIMPAELRIALFAAREEIS